jgi:hypothetical protein
MFNTAVWFTASSGLGEHAARTITALLTLRDHVIAPILAVVRSPGLGRKPAHWTHVNWGYEVVRIGAQPVPRPWII